MEAPIKINKDLPLIAQNHSEESQSEGQAEVRSLRAQVLCSGESVQLLWMMLTHTLLIIHQLTALFVNSHPTLFICQSIRSHHDRCDVISSFSKPKPNHTRIKSIQLNTLLSNIRSQNINIKRLDLKMSGLWWSRCQCNVIFKNAQMKTFCLRVLTAEIVNLHWSASLLWPKVWIATEMPFPVSVIVLFLFSQLFYNVNICIKYFLLFLHKAYNSQSSAEENHIFIFVIYHIITVTQTNVGEIIFTTRMFIHFISFFNPGLLLLLLLIRKTIKTKLN